MRVLLAIWRRTRRQNVDFYPEQGRCHQRLGFLVKRRAADRESGVSRLLHLAGVLRLPAGGTMGMERINIDLKKGVVKYPITKTHAAGEGEPVITDTPVVIDPTVIFDSTMVMDLITDVTKITNANVVFDVTKITDATMVLDSMAALVSNVLDPGSNDK